jgi:LacI family transcriptional regulator
MTIREIASVANVSPATVSLVLNNKKGVGDETRGRVQSILKEYGYTVEQNSRKTERCKIVFLKYRTHGMAVEENQGFIASIIDWIESECRNFYYDLVISNCTAGTISQVLESTLADAPDGIILLGTELDPELHHILNNSSIPIVVLDNSMRYENIDSVVMANGTIMATAVKYLYKLGHRKIGYLKTNVEISNLKERYAGYLDALEELEVTPPKPVYLTPTMNGAYSDMKELLASGLYKPEGAVLADNDSIAIGAMRALQEAGFQIPRDISIIGVDDIPFSSIAMPALTTVRVSRSTMGYLAVDVMRKRIQHPEWPAMHVQLTGQLIERDSTAFAL